MNHAGVRRLLDDARDEVALLVAELTEDLLVVDGTDALEQNALRLGDGDVTEVGRVNDLFAGALVLVVVHGSENRDVARLAVEADAGANATLFVLELDGGRLVVDIVRNRGDVLDVGANNRVLDDQREFLERNLFFDFNVTQLFDIDVHGAPPIQFWTNLPHGCG